MYAADVKLTIRWPMFIQYTAATDRRTANNLPFVLCDDTRQYEKEHLMFTNEPADGRKTLRRAGEGR